MAALMLQGTGSNVGKSLLVAGLCRAFTNRGLQVRPFKPQNMATNSAITADGSEIGRAQALQALACRVAPHPDMNPVLLKPEADHSAQLIVQGRAAGHMHASNFRDRRPSLLPQVLASYRRLQADCDLVVVEGAGSPAEINLRAGDIANMGFARAARVPVVLVGDINRGGVIAAIAGTRQVLAAADTAMIRGFIINRFRGDPALFAEGYQQTQQHSGWRGFGIVPWLAEAARLPSEDSLAPMQAQHSGRLSVACPILPHIANFDDLDPLKSESDIELHMVPPGRPLPSGATMIVLPDSVNCVADMQFLRAEGWDIDILAHHRQGGHVLGLGSGSFLLGERINDPTQECEVQGLGLLRTTAELLPDAAPAHVEGVALGTAFAAFDRGMARISGADCKRPFARSRDGRTIGATSADGRIWGSSLQGMLGNTGLRAALLEKLGAASNATDHAEVVHSTLDSIARALEAHLDVDALLALAKEDT